MSKHHSAKPEPDKIPSSVNPNLKHRVRRGFTKEEFLTEILAQNRVMLSRAMTLVESRRPADYKQARSIVEGCLPYSGKSFRLGITGVPGVGKSTFIESLGLQLIKNGHRVAVLTVDPSSQLTGGSILGDKTRMPLLSTNEQAFIRPSPAGQSLGGVAAKTRELILLCEAAGYDFIIVETVGVGQSEVAVHALTDFFLLLLLPGGGDELQGIKRGVVEMADMIAVNKADGDQKLAAQKARAAYQRALHLFPAKNSRWVANAVTCSAINNIGVDDIIGSINTYKKQTEENHFFLRQRKDQAIQWFRQSLNEAFLARYYNDEKFVENIKMIEKQIAEGTISPQAGVEKILEKGG